MALKDWPERIRYTWSDDVTGTPYSLVFDNPASAIAFIVNQRNNLVDADSILESLSDADTGESLAAPTNSASADDVTAVATGQQTILPTPEPTDEPSEPTDTDTTANASPIAAETTAAPVPTESAVPSNPPENSGTGASVPPTELGSDTTATSAPALSDAVTPPPASDAPTASLPAPSDSTADDTAPTADTADDESDDFDSVGTDDESEPDDTQAVPLDGPVSTDTAPALGAPTVETPGVTGTANTDNV